MDFTRDKSAYECDVRASLQRPHFQIQLGSIELSLLSRTQAGQP
jgi:hypothetical protein